MTKTPERFTWALSIVKPKQKEAILEIGCGTGILLEQIAGFVLKGSVIAVDKSRLLLNQAAKRNKQFLSSGRLELIHAEFSEHDFTANHFDKIVAFNVNFFLKNSGKEFKLILKALKPKGLLYIFYQFPYEMNPGIPEEIKTHLKSCSFKIKKSGIEKMEPTSSLFIIAAKN